MALTKTHLFSIMGLRIQGDVGPFTCYTSKRKKVVFFLKAPPEKPASEWQTSRRHRFKMAAAGWRGLTNAKRALWELATKRLSFRLTGYNLWVWYYVKGDRPGLATIERHSGLTLIEG